MITRPKEELQRLMDILRNHIENKKEMQITLSISALCFLHDSILLSKLIVEYCTKNKLTGNEGKALKEMNADCYSEMESVIYEILDTIKEGSNILVK